MPIPIRSFFKFSYLEFWLADQRHFLVNGRLVKETCLIHTTLPYISRFDASFKINESPVLQFIFWFHIK